MKGLISGAGILKSHYTALLCEFGGINTLLAENSCLNILQEKGVRHTNVFARFTHHTINYPKSFFLVNPDKKSVGWHL